MYYELYIDQFFAEHLLTGYLLLRLTALSLGRKPEFKRILLAALQQAAAMTLAVICSVQYGERLQTGRYLLLVIWYVCSMAGAMRIAFGKNRISIYRKQMLRLMWNTIFFAGIQETATGTMQLSESEAAVAAALLMGILLKYGEHRQKCSVQTAEVTVFWEEKSQSLTGIIDTGNLLQEPLTGKPVSIVEKSAILPLLGENWQQKRGFYLIPYHSIGTEKGWLQAFRANRMEIRTEQQLICAEQPILAVYEGNLSAQKKYQIILHQGHAGEKGEEI